jgi:hypothetical protein
MKKNFYRIFAVLFCILMCVPFLSGCNKEMKTEDSKPSFVQVINEYQSADAKSGSLSLRFRMSFYGPEGPITTAQNITATRTQKDGYYYIGGEARTDTAKSDYATKRFKNLVELASDFSGNDTALQYIDGQTRIVFEGGIYNGFYNGRLDVQPVGLEPDYMMTDHKGVLRSEFYGVSESDVQSFAADLGYQAEKPFHPEDYFMYISLDTFDWSRYPDSAPSEYNETTQSYHYRLTIPGAELKAAVIAQIDLFTLFFASTQNEDIAELLTLYADNKEFVSSLFSVSDCTVNARASKEGMLLDLRYTFNFGIRITDSQILSKANQYVDTEEMPPETLQNYLTLMHTFFTTKSNENNAIEIDFVLDMTETYTYGSAVTVDTASVIFAGAQDAPQGRTVYVYRFDEEKQEKIFAKSSAPM